MFKRKPNYIVHINGETGIRPVQIFEKKFIVGRKPNHLVSIQDNSISRDHIEVFIESKQIYILDLGTSNGTKINGIKIPSKIPTPYNEGQQLTLGLSSVNFTIERFDKNRDYQLKVPNLEAPATSIPEKSLTQKPIINLKVDSANPAIITTEIPPPLKIVEKSNIEIQTPKELKPIETIKSDPPKLQILTNLPQNDPEIFIDTIDPVDDPIALNRTLAKAKIDAEIGIRDLIRSKKAEAQEIIDRAEMIALEKTKEAQKIIDRAEVIALEKAKEAQKIIDRADAIAFEKTNEAQLNIDAILKQTTLEAENVKQSILDTAEKDKENILNELNASKIIVLNEIETLQQQIPNLTSESQSLLSLIQKNQAEKTITENQYNQEQLRLEKIRAEIKSQEIKLQNVHLQEEILQSRLNEADTKYKASLLANQTINNEMTLRSEQVKQQELEIKEILKNALIEKEISLKYAENQRAEVELFVKSKHEETNRWILTNRENFELELKNKMDQAHQEISKLNQERAKVESDSIERRSQIERELHDRREVLTRVATEEKAHIENEARELKVKRDQEYKNLKNQQDAYLLDLKNREESRLIAMIDESRKVIREQFNIKNDNIQKSFSNFFIEYSKKAPIEIQAHLNSLKKELENVLHKSLKNELTGEDQKLRQLFDYDPNLEKKHKNYWLRFAAISAIIFLIIGGILYNPNQITNGAQAIKETVNNIDIENKKNQAEALEKFKQAAIYKPITDNTFKETYTDNILFTNRYLEFENDEDYRNQWIVAMKEFLTTAAHILDDKADELISKEGSLIVNLSSEVTTIDGRNPKKGIMRMREKENEFNQQLTKAINNESTHILKNKKQAFYERYINDSSKRRSPAKYDN